MRRRIGRVLAQNIVNPLDQLGARFDTFAKGDLSSEFPEMTSEDEISEMVVVAREMAKNLATVIQDVNHRMGTDGSQRLYRCIQDPGEIYG